MINKQSLWFITLFSLILILGIYYITMPSQFLKNIEDVKTVNSEISVDVSESDKFISMRALRDEELESAMKNLESELTNEELSTEERNQVYEELKVLNLTKGKEEILEDKISDKFKIKSYIEIDNDNIKVVINSKEHNATLANNIMRCVQEEYEDKKFITVKFEE
jgi:stage III sporulation protein AH